MDMLSFTIVTVILFVRVIIVRLSLLGNKPPEITLYSKALTIAKGSTYERAYKTGSSSVQIILMSAVIKHIT